MSMEDVQIFSGEKGKEVSKTLKPEEHNGPWKGKVPRSHRLRNQAGWMESAQRGRKEQGGRKIPHIGHSPRAAKFLKKGEGGNNSLPAHFDIRVMRMMLPKLVERPKG